jgi:hypothetical protein
VFGAVLDGVLLALAVLVVAIVVARGLLHGVEDAILLVLIAGPISLYSIRRLFFAAFARIGIADGIVEIRNPFGTRRSFPQTQIRRAARRSILAPAQDGIYRDELLLVGEDGICLWRGWVGDYDVDQLKAIVGRLGLKWPPVRRASIRRVRREFPGAHPIDYQFATVGILIVEAVILVIAIAVARVR